MFLACSNRSLLTPFSRTTSILSSLKCSRIMAWTIFSVVSLAAGQKRHAPENLMNMVLSFTRDNERSPPWLRNSGLIRSRSTSSTVVSVNISDFTANIYCLQTVKQKISKGIICQEIHQCVQLHVQVSSCLRYLLDGQS